MPGPAGQHTHILQQDRARKKGNGAVVVAADPAGVPGCGRESGDADEPVGGFKDGEVSSGGANELRGEVGSEPGHALQHLGVPVFGDFLADQRIPEPHPTPRNPGLSPFPDKSGSMELGFTVFFAGYFMCKSLTDHIHPNE